ncbi:MAG TPA: GNAT family N-acetyltransferase, partial [Thermoguttaceae bacterium]|nr:GNAT family N-acetyltransferase [Thermoguttaceae bacterium]
NPRIKQIDGRLLPFGFLRLLSNRREIKKIRLISTNVVPEFQLMGIGLLLMHGMVPLAMQWEIEEAEFSWVMESNSFSRGSLEKGGAKRTKTYRLYDRDDPQPAESILARSRHESQQRRHAASSAVSLAGPLAIRRVQGRADLNRFVRMPYPIYTADPHWVAPLEIDVKEFLNPKKHPFLQHGEAAQFLAMRGKTPVGRILVSDDPRYNRQYGKNAGCFGMFESVDDTEVAHGLLETAADWLRGRGRDTIMGPIDYSTNYPCGLLVDGFDTPPRVMMNHNRPYYAELLESWGLSKAKDLYCWWFTGKGELLQKWQSRVERITRRTRVTIRPFRPHDFDEEVRRCREIYNEALRENWGFVDLTEAEFQGAAKRFMSITPPDLALIAEVDGRMVGFSVTVPDLNEMIRPLRGRLTNRGLPVNLARFLYRKPRVKVGRMMVLEVLKQYRRRGIAEALILKTFEYGKNSLGFTGAELGWTLEDNDAVNRTIEAVGGRHYKTYRIYDKPLSPAAPA